MTYMLCLIVVAMNAVESGSPLRALMLVYSPATLDLAQVVLPWARCAIVFAAGLRKQWP